MYINHYAGSDVHGMAFRPFYLAKEWQKKECEVLILAASFSHLRKINPSFEGFCLDEEIEGINFRWYKTNKYEGNGYKRFLNMFLFLIGLWKDIRALIGFRPTHVISSSTYPMDSFLASYISKKSGAKHIHEVHDLWPLSPMTIGKMSKYHPFILLTQFAEDFVCKSCDKCISILPMTKKYLVSRGLDCKKFAYIPNGFDGESWSAKVILPEELQSKLQNIRNESNFILGYTGAFGIPNSLDNVLNAMSQISNNDIKAILIGDGHEKSRLVQRIEREELKNVIILDPVEKRYIPEILKFFDAAYLGAPNFSLYQFGVTPNKLIEYMKSRLPIIWALKAGNDPVLEARCGYSIEPEHPQQLKEAIIKMYNLDRSKLHIMAENAYTYANSNFSYEIIAKQFLDNIE